MDMNKMLLHGCSNYIKGNYGVNSINNIDSTTTSFAVKTMKKDNIVFNENGNNHNFSAELNKAISEAKQDLRKMASIDRKNEIKQMVRQGSYVTDARAVAMKIMSAGGIDKFI